MKKCDRSKGIGNDVPESVNRVSGVRDGERDDSLVALLAQGRFTEALVHVDWNALGGDAYVSECEGALLAGLQCHESEDVAGIAEALIVFPSLRGQVFDKLAAAGVPLGEIVEVILGCDGSKDVSAALLARLREFVRSATPHGRQGAALVVLAQRSSEGRLVVRHGCRLAEESPEAMELAGAALVAAAQQGWRAGVVSACSRWVSGEEKRLRMFALYVMRLLGACEETLRILEGCDERWSGQDLALCAALAETRRVVAPGACGGGTGCGECG